jgi:hypothetical protein
MKTKAGKTRAAFFTRQWMSGFLSNVLGVIVGIALTFGISYLIQRHNEKKTIHILMDLLKKEITDNRDELVKMDEDFRQTKEAYGIFLSSRWKTIPEDSIGLYLNRTQNITSYKLRYTAWNVFQNSDVIGGFDDKELIVELSEWYSSIEEALKWWEMFSSEKMATATFRANNAPDIPAYVDLLLKNKPTRQFMEEMYVYRKYTFEEPFANIIAHADSVLHLIK